MHSYLSAKHFSMLRAELQYFLLDSMSPLNDKTLVQSVFRWPTESCVMSAKCSWNWTFCNWWSSMGRGITFGTALWYWSIGLMLITSKMEMHMQKSNGKSLVFEHESKLQRKYLQTKNLKAKSFFSRYRELLFNLLIAFVYSTLVIRMTSSGYMSIN